MQAKLIATLVLSLLSGSVLAEFSVEEYEKVRARPGTRAYEDATLYILGIGEGIAWANVALANKKMPRLYCPPPNLAMNANNYLQMADNAAKESHEKLRNVKEISIEILLLNELQTTFPCK